VPVELEVRWAAPAKAEPPPPPPAPSRPEVRAHGAKAVAKAAAPKASSPGPSSPPAPLAEANGGVPVPQAMLDAPTAAPPSLIPRAGFVHGLQSGLEDELPKGTTVGNTPADLPDPVAMREYQGDALRRTLNTQLKQDLAQAEAGAGRVAPYFHSLEVSLRNRAGTRSGMRWSPKPKDAVDAMTRAVLDPTISPEAARKVANSALGRSVMNQAVPLPDAESQHSREAALQAMARSEAIMEHLEQSHLSTVVAVVFDATGAIADTSIEVPSSDPTFDDSAVQLSRKAVRDLPELEVKGLGTSWWRTRWRFSWAPAGVRVHLIDAVPLEPSLR
jgi:hypothetical protein